MMKRALISRMTDPVSEQRQRYIRGLFDSEEMHSMDAQDKLFKWDKGIVEGGGFWMLFREGYRLTYIPFDEELTFEKLDGPEPDNGIRWNYVASDDQGRLQGCMDELIDYVSSKIRPISIMSGTDQGRGNMLQTRGHGFC